MPYLEINPRYQEMLFRQGLRAPEDFLALPAVIISGHPNRNVARVELGSGPNSMGAFLKREHRIRWKDRILNACAGFGLVSKSRRECRMLQAFAAANVGCAEWMAVGEDGRGRAFLLVRELEKCSDLRVYLRQRMRAHPVARRRFAQELGRALAHLHDAGFDHPDLYSKHVVVNADSQAIHFLDVQRSRRRKLISWRRRWNDLAALDVTLSHEVLSTKDRLACLRAYLRSYRIDRGRPCANILRSAFRIFCKAARLLPERRIQEIRAGPRPGVVQRLIWIDGEALCVTPEFNSMLAGSPPDWLRLAKLPQRPRHFEKRQRVSANCTKQSLLVCRRQTRILAWAWSCLRRRRLESPELRQSGLIFRLQRAGIQTPRLLAFGQRRVLPWQVESFLLTEPAEGISASRWLGVNNDRVADGWERTHRRRLIAEAGRLLRRLHQARCYIGRLPGEELILVTTNASSVLSARTYSGPRAFSNFRAVNPGLEPESAVVQDQGTLPSVSLANIDTLVTCRSASGRRARKDLFIVRQELGALLASRTDQLRFLLAYLGCRKVDRVTKRLARSFLGCARPRIAQLQRAHFHPGAWGKPPVERSGAP